MPLFALMRSPPVCHRASLIMGAILEACPRRTTAVALQEDQYAHGSIQLATEHHSDELMSLLDLLEDLDDTIALLDLTTSRVEKEDQS